VGLYLLHLIADRRAKQVITDRRNRLGTDSVECVECLHHWLDSGMISGVCTEQGTVESMVVDG
jgi:hypothetical protein